MHTPHVNSGNAVKFSMLAFQDNLTDLSSSEIAIVHTNQVNEGLLTINATEEKQSSNFSGASTSSLAYEALRNYRYVAVNSGEIAESLAQTEDESTAEDAAMQKVLAALDGLVPKNRHEETLARLVQIIEHLSDQGIHYENGRFHIEMTDSVDDIRLDVKDTTIEGEEGKDTTLRLGPRVKRWIERHILGVGSDPSPIGAYISGIQEILRILYPTFNPILILQGKIGTGYDVGRIAQHELGGWAQWGFQVNVISRGIELSRKPILQVFPLHTEMGLAAANVSGMSVQNLGLNFVPDAVTDEYPWTNPQVMYEEVLRCEAGKIGVIHEVHGLGNAELTDQANLVINSGIGLEPLKHRYWSGRGAIIAGGLLATAKAIGGAIGYLAGSQFTTGLENLAGATNLLAGSTGSADALLQDVSANATVVGQSNNTAFFGVGASNSTTHLTALRGVNETFGQPQNWSHVGAVMGSQFAAALTSRLLDATTSLQPDERLNLKEATLNAFDCFFNIPLSNGTVFTFAALPRLQLTSLRHGNEKTREIHANEPYHKEKFDPNRCTSLADTAETPTIRRRTSRQMRVSADA